MKAIIFEEFGPPDVLQIKEIDEPACTDNEVIVNVKASAINYGDIIVRNLGNISPSEFNMPLPMWLLSKLFLGISKPKRKTPGSEFAGVIAEVGKNVKSFKVGDKVFGYTSMNLGANSELLKMKDSAMIAKMPNNISFIEASSVPYGAHTALSLLSKVKIMPHHKVLINGASGSIGSFAVQLASNYGAEVTGVCSSNRIDFVKSLGAKKVINYKEVDFTEVAEKYDLIFDVLGRTPVSKCKKVLNKHGIILYSSFKMNKVLQMMLSKTSGTPKVICALASETRGNLVTIRDMIEAGKLKTEIDKTFPMEKAADAHRYYESSERRSNVVITMD